MSGDSSSTPPFDPNDLKYQVSPSHAPDKSSSWDGIPLEADRWVLAHDSIRSELTEMGDALRNISDPLPEWAVSSIRKWWEGHSLHVREHCAKEEEMLMPFASERIKWPEDVTTSDDHGKIEEWQREVGRLVDGLGKDGEDRTTVKALREAWESYELKLRPHLLEEERVCLPLVRVYFTPEEMSPVGRKMMEAEPDSTMGAMVHAMGTKEFRSVFMTGQGIPSFVWHMAFKSRHANYENDMAVHVEALKTGRPPKEGKSGWFF
uniref:Hemerythrin-like domain-containing protein n=1 Tax=Odontella aurita TaxID=265563 RepID=A0A7S4K2U1_9STRA|mmetsp:Transcript_60155/g.178351  ORF Transcript_60155/g.178351 Transcript_60155/m.178351 type:complete len:263 (+) Transcript_60155:36-824(+)